MVHPMGRPAESACVPKVLVSMSSSESGSHPQTPPSRSGEGAASIIPHLPRAVERQRDARQESAWHDPTRREADDATRDRRLPG